jgi:hypothetical protein
LRALSFTSTARAMLSALLGENMPTSTLAMSSADLAAPRLMMTRESADH